MPQEYLNKFCKAGGGPFDNITFQDNMRMTYHAMVYYLDEQVGKLVDKFKAKGMWNNTLMLFVSDNGGPIYAAANNYPHRGGKYSSFEGGVRVAAFSAGGLVSEGARGTVGSGIGSVADIYATFATLAGESIDDPVAKAAGLAPVDGMDLTEMLTGTGPSPRYELPLEPMGSSDMNKFPNPNSIEMAQLEQQWGLAAGGGSGGGPVGQGAGGGAPPDGFEHMCNKIQGWTYLDQGNISAHKHVLMNDCCGLCNSTKGCAAGVWEPDNHTVVHSPGTCYLKRSRNNPALSKHACTFVASNVPLPPPVLLEQAGFIQGDMKIIIGQDVAMSIFTGPHYPNASTPWCLNNSVKVPSFACSTVSKRGCLFNVTADPGEHNDLYDTNPQLFHSILLRLLNVSRAGFTPDRGKVDHRACKQCKKNADPATGYGFFGPWLELPPNSS